ncbi:protein arginine methyltransferase NDUFAF7 homolog, mitochondrial-like isoform X1 [Venturia canescens]|uniref:protein arginine methyltransferase NDUFAF7 homolog, mitochondrial-like isoform X1 n=1 Tax=Venturia canescens TaxID=32260 RepID=UPI001C9C03BA|nr:protein arginine methyltransferase NDUFAF7 homolog, mitochondrial-like isoform X1 [Venturia canescens]XP_043282363.1 protein arginine methyltransferase NDUFAF7 homolog, mitochondrial-like isoform X1 [Venturia canescens]
MELVLKNHRFIFHNRNKMWSKVLNFTPQMQCKHFRISTRYCTRPLAGILTRSKNYSTQMPEEAKEYTLFKHLTAKIKACGPITVADYMKEVLTHPTAGYYMNRDVFGQHGDFITSPEISQLFGEMIGIWIVNELSKITEDSFQLVELGPGRGTLCKDILRVLKRLKLIHRASIHLVEISPALSKIQSEKLCVSSKECPQAVSKKDNSVSHYREGLTEEGIKVFWYSSIKDIPKKFSVFVAHEFFDALPIHKFQKTGDIWNEVLIDIDPKTENEKKFRYVLTKRATPASAIFVSRDEKRDHVEVSPQTIVIIDYMASFLEEFGGFALIADYGHNGEKTDTFRSFRRHEQYDPLMEPGTADLTADVDFSLIDRVGRKESRLISFGPMDQCSFLKNLGIDVRLEMLLKNASDEERSHIESGYHMIMDEDKMGTRFKVFSFFPSVLEAYLAQWPVAGFSNPQQEASKK